MNFLRSNKNNSYIKFTRLLLVVLFLFLTTRNTIIAQDYNLDSLKMALQKEKNDSVKCMILSLLVEHSEQGEWMEFNFQLRELAEKNLKMAALLPSELRYYSQMKTISVYNEGTSEYEKGNYQKAKLLFDECLELYTKQNSKTDVAYVLQSIALIHQARGEIVKAIEVNMRSLKLSEETNNLESEANVLNSLGLLHDSQKEYEKAIENFNKCYTICIKRKDRKGALYALINMAFTYQNQKDFNKALVYSVRSLKMAEQMEDKFAHAYALSNLGVLYSNYGDPKVITSKEASIQEGNKKAISYFLNCLALREEIGDKNGIAQSLSLIANRYGALKMPEKSEEYFLKALKISKEIGSPKNTMSAATGLYNIYKTSGRFSKALEFYELSISMRDSLRNEATKKASIKSQLKYEYEKQAAADSVAHAKESEIKNAELAKQKAEISIKKNQQYALFGGLALVMIFAVFMYNRFKVTQKQKSIIEEQKEVVEEQKKLVEEKQKEILDSIQYARRIQMAQIPSETRISLMLSKFKKL